MSVAALGAGECTDVSVEMLSPAEPGLYSSKWRMSTTQGNFFGGKKRDLSDTVMGLHLIVYFLLLAGKKSILCSRHLYKNLFPLSLLLSLSLLSLTSLLLQ